MAVPGALFGCKMGPDIRIGHLGAAGATTVAMAALNQGVCHRFVATQNKDVFSVLVNWSSVASPGQVTARIETIDATTGKPTGTLYDANATKAFTPAAGWQTVTFDSNPTTNLTVGTQYAVVLLTTSAGTTQTIRAHLGSNAHTSGYPVTTLTAADGTTRSNFAEVAGSVPLCSLLLDDGTEDPMGMLPYAATTNNNIFGTAGVALKIVLAGGTFSFAGLEALVFSIGTPAGDLRIRIFDSSNSTAANSTYTLDKDSATSGLSVGRSLLAMFGGLVSCAAGTYRVVFDSASSANSSNCWRIISCPPSTTNVDPSSMVLSTCADVGTPSWTDSATADQVPVHLIIDSISAAATATANKMHGKL